MNPHDILILGIKRSVVAICRADGSILWETELPEGSGNSFVTLTSDLQRVYAACHGVLHCLELQSGTILWANPLKGYGYGVASLCLPGQPADLSTASAGKAAADHAAATAAAAAAAAR